MKEVATMLKAIHAQEDADSATVKAEPLTKKLRKAAQKVRDGADEH